MKMRPLGWKKKMVDDYLEDVRRLQDEALMAGEAQMLRLDQEIERLKQAQAEAASDLEAAIGLARFYPELEDAVRLIEQEIAEETAAAAKQKEADIEASFAACQDENERVSRRTEILMYQFQVLMDQIDRVIRNAPVIKPEAERTEDYMSDRYDGSDAEAEVDVVEERGLNVIRFPRQNRPAGGDSSQGTKRGSPGRINRVQNVDIEGPVRKTPDWNTNANSAPAAAVPVSVPESVLPGGEMEEQRVRETMLNAEPEPVDPDVTEIAMDAGIPSFMEQLTPAQPPEPVIAAPAAKAEEKSIRKPIVTAEPEWNDPDVTKIAMDAGIPSFMEQLTPAQPPEPVIAAPAAKTEEKDTRHISINAEPEWDDPDVTEIAMDIGIPVFTEQPKTAPSPQPPAQPAARLSAPEAPVAPPMPAAPAASHAAQPKTALREAAASSLPGGLDPKQVRYIVGNIVGNDLVSTAGEQLCSRGEIITREMVMKVFEAGKLVDLVVDMVLPDDDQPEL